MALRTFIFAKVMLAPKTEVAWWRRRECTLVYCDYLLWELAVWGGLDYIGQLLARSTKEQRSVSIAPYHHTHVIVVSDTVRRFFSTRAVSYRVAL